MGKTPHVDHTADTLNQTLGFMQVVTRVKLYWGRDPDYMGGMLAPGDHAAGACIIEKNLGFAHAEPRLHSSK